MTKARDAKKRKKRELAKLESQLVRCKAKMHQLHGEITRLRDDEKARNEIERVNYAIITLLLEHYKADKDHPAVLRKDDIPNAMREMFAIADVTEDGEYRLHYERVGKAEEETSEARE